MVLVQILLDLPTCASKLLRDGYYLMSVVFHLRWVFVGLPDFTWASWLLTGANSEFGLEGVKTQCQCTLTSWPASIYEIDHQDNPVLGTLNSIMLLSNIVSQTPHWPPALAVISALFELKVGPSQHYDAFLISGCHSVLLLGQKLNSQIRMLVYSFYCFRKSSIKKAQFLCVSGVEH